MGPNLEETKKILNGKLNVCAMSKTIQKMR